jgi:hypothetical protein
MVMSMSFITKRKDYLYRYEPNLDEGTLFIFQIANGKIMQSNSVGFDILTLLESGITEISELVVALSEKYPSVNPNELKKDILSFIDELQDFDIVEEI